MMMMMMMMMDDQVRAPLTLSPIRVSPQFADDQVDLGHLLRVVVHDGPVHCLVVLLQVGVGQLRRLGEGGEQTTTEKSTTGFDTYT